MTWEQGSAEDVSDVARKPTEEWSVSAKAATTCPSRAQTPLPVADLNVRVLTEEGEALRHLTLGPSRNYQAIGRSDVPTMP